LISISIFYIDILENVKRCKMVKMIDPYKDGINRKTKTNESISTHNAMPRGNRKDDLQLHIC
jgi:hypothetical protein